MSKKNFKTQASSSRITPSAFGSTSAFGGASTFGAAPASTLSYVYEPPDLSLISDSHIQQTFKTLQKKNSTTKGKALEDLQSHVAKLENAGESVEDSILKAWIILYPRTSIDNSRRVRQLSHGLQGQLAVACGKRIAKHMPLVAGAWVGGLQDNDKAVAREAQAAFVRVFPTQEKQQGVWKAFQAPILEYCRYVLLNETPQTLSDERVTSPDEAETKYARVVGTSLLAMSYALKNLSETDIQKEVATYSQIFGSKEIWKFSSHQDAFVRRAIFRFLAAALPKLQESIDFKLVSTYVLQDGLHCSQSGSANEYIKTILQITKAQPQVWTDYYTGTGKKAVSKRVISFVRKGSQGAPADFWLTLSILLHDLPIEALQPSADNDTDESLLVLVALQDGVTRKEEFRPTQNEAWKAYLQLAARLLSSSTITEKSRTTICTKHILPLLAQYVRPSAEATKWNVAGKSLEVCNLATMVSLRSSPDAVRQALGDISASLIQDMQVSLPEQSKDFENSQANVIDQAQRWYSLVTVLLQSSKSDELRPILLKILRSEVVSETAILKNRNGKPFSAAAALASGIRVIPELTINDIENRNALVNFAQNDIASLTTSPSSPYLLQILESLSSADEVNNIYETCLRSLIDAPRNSARGRALRTLLSSPWPKDTSAAHALSDISRGSLREALEGHEDAWPLAEESLKNHSSPPELLDDLLATLTDSLSIEDQVKTSFSGFEILAQHNSKAIRNYVTSSQGTIFLSRLLYLSGVDEEDHNIQERAIKLKATADRLISNDQYASVATDSMIDIIRNGTLDTATTALTIESLVEQSKKLVEDKNEEEATEILQRLLVDEDTCAATFAPFISKPPTKSLALTNALGGAVGLVDVDKSNPSNINARYDVDGFSSLYRLASFCAAISKTTQFKGIASEDQIRVLQLLIVYLEVSKDNLLVITAHPLWRIDDPSTELDTKITAKHQQLAIFDSLRDHCAEHSHFGNALKSKLLEDARGSGTSSYYNARAYASLVLELASHGDHSDEDSRLSSIRRSSDPIADVAFLAGVETSKATLKLCNELFSDLAAKSLDVDEEYTLPRLVLLNRLIDTYQGKLEDVPQQRVVFFVKHVVTSLQSSTSSLPLVAEAFKTLQSVVLIIKDLYGEFWADLIDDCISVLNMPDSDLVTQYNCLELCSTLQTLAREAANDDLEESWAEKENGFARALDGLLIRASDAPSTSDEPAKMLHRSLGRRLQSVNIKTIDDVSHLYKPLASDASSLQHAAYGILHQKIPTEQEQVSLDAALSADFSAQLLEELVRLIAQAPEPEKYINLRNATDIPAPFTRYLFSWKLVFDHWINASYKVQSDYVSQLKSTGHINGLLRFATEVLIHRKGSKSTINPSRFDLTTYVPYQTADAKDPKRVANLEQDAQWLLSHIYYLALAHLPTLVKEWWRSSCPRYLERQMEEWTEKYISPAVIAAELSTVSAWEPNPDDTTEMEVRVVPRTREIIASYPIDEQQMSIQVSLSPAHPLKPITVSGHRVGVDEKKWGSWLNTTTLAINFSSSSQGLGCVIDGLVAWRKNVVGSLKGQSECAICYSIVGADKQLPSKRCGTCKNMFHGSCLFRWFKSSSSSSCPLCRNAFNYG